MKLLAGIYKIPDMFPKSFQFPGGYQITNTADERHWVTLAESVNEGFIYSEGIEAKDSVCLYLQEGNFLKIKGECEIIPYNPEG